MRRSVCSTVTDSSVRARFQVSGWIQPAAASPWRLKEKLAAPLVSESNPRLQGDPQDAFICSSVYRCVCVGSWSLSLNLHQVFQTLITVLFLNFFLLNIQETWKAAAVLPLHKDGDPSDLNYYCLSQIVLPLLKY